MDKHENVIISVECKGVSGVRRPHRKPAAVYFLDLLEKRERLESRREAAEALGVHPQHLYNIEKQRSGVSLPLAVHFVRRYGPLHLVVPDDGDIFLLQQVGDKDGLWSSRPRYRPWDR